MSPGDTRKAVTIAEKLDGVLKKEFQNNMKDAENDVGRTFNETAQNSQAQMETVIKVSAKKPKKDVNETEGNPGGTYESEGSSEKVSNKTDPSAMGVEAAVPTIIDKEDNEFVLSKPKESAALTLDPRLIQDLTVLITASAAIGMLFEAVGQPVINGYLVAGAIVGPGGLTLVKEIVQVESLAQLGVQLLLFSLGLEFSVSKMRVVGGVALIGGLAEILISVCLAAKIATFTGAKLGQGIFVGALVPLSSTSVVANCLESSRTSGTKYGQITIGTLILQDCIVGILFALMPLLAEDDNGESEWKTVMLIGQVTVKLFAVMVAATFFARSFLPFIVRALARYASSELFQVSLVAFCLVGAWTTGWLGLSQELGAFVAGATLSVSDQHEIALKSVDGARNIFTTLFIASIGLVMSPVFLWEHLRFLALGVAAVFICKTILITAVVLAFRFEFRLALLVGLSLAQITEFAFVLLSAANDAGIIQQEMYLMLIGMTALSLLMTPGVVSLARKLLLPEDAFLPMSSLSGKDNETALLHDEESVIVVRSGHRRR